MLKKFVPETFTDARDQNCAVFWSGVFESFWYLEPNTVAFYLAQLSFWYSCRGITGRLTMQIYPDLPEVPIF